MKRLAILLALYLVSSAAPAADLLAVYQRALQNDPQLREAEATRLAALEAKPQPCRRCCRNCREPVSSLGRRTPDRPIPRNPCPAAPPAAPRRSSPFRSMGASTPPPTATASTSNKTCFAGKIGWPCSVRTP